MSDNQQESVNVVVDTHRTPYQAPVRTSWQHFSLFLNSAIVCYVAGWVTNLASYLPLTAVLVTALPKIALGTALLVIGIYWAATRRVPPMVTSYAIAVVLGILIGL